MILFSKLKTLKKHELNFLKLKKLIKHKFDFFALLNKLKKYQFNFSNLKSSKMSINFFASSKNMNLIFVSLKKIKNMYSIVCKN